MQDVGGNLQWHPAFYAGLQIELEKEKEKLSFENEHQLGTKPKAIDVLVIKKESDYRVKKNIGRIFRKYNIIEYKSPLESLSIDDFYQIYGYTCFYKSDAVSENSISAEEITITFLCTRYPRKLLQYLQEVEHLTIREIEQGICYVEGDRFPIQIIIIPRLSRQENLWLKNLTNHLEHVSDAKDLITEYIKHKNNVLYQSVMDVVVSANIEKFREVKKMCNALMELMKDEFEEIEKMGISQGISQGTTKGQTLQMITLIQRKLKKGKSLETAAYELEEDTDAIKNIYEMAKAHPAAGNEEIYQFLHPVV